MKRILLVDDAKFMRQRMKVLLEENDFKVVGEAENGNIAVEKYKSLDPDIVIMDIIMPELDGIGALKSIKNYDERCNVIIVSAIAETSKVKEAVLAGAKNFIAKPFDNEHFIRVLQAI
jgi:two-component system chemotaxis response regulator CheY